MPSNNPNGSQGLTGGMTGCFPNSVYGLLFHDYVGPAAFRAHSRIFVASVLPRQTSISSARKKVRQTVRFSDGFPRGFAESIPGSRVSTAIVLQWLPNAWATAISSPLASDISFTSTGVCNITLFQPNHRNMRINGLPFQKIGWPPPPVAFKPEERAAHHVLYSSGNAGLVESCRSAYIHARGQRRTFRCQQNAVISKDDRCPSLLTGKSVWHSQWRLPHHSEGPGRNTSSHWWVIESISLPAQATNISLKCRSMVLMAAVVSYHKNDSS